MKFLNINLEQPGICLTVLFKISLYDLYFKNFNYKYNNLYFSFQIKFIIDHKIKFISFNLNNNIANILLYTF